MFTLNRIERFAQDIKKSRFLAVAAPVVDEAEARAFLAAYSDLDANHNCWAWRIGQVYRFSDDGEPSGTAGRPILQAIEGQELDQVAVVVTRWFGGILLGSGGLMRAYGGTAAACLRQAQKTAVVPSVSVRICCVFFRSGAGQGPADGGARCAAGERDLHRNGCRPRLQAAGGGGGKPDPHGGRYHQRPRRNHGVIAAFRASQPALQAGRWPCPSLRGSPFPRVPACFPPSSAAPAPHRACCHHPGHRR